MKRSLLLFGLLLLSGAVAATTLEHGSDTSNNAVKIRIVTKSTPSATKPQPKAPAINVVECWVDAENGSIELQFNRPIGTATIAIATVAGSTISATTVDTSLTDYVVVAAPAQSGFYTIAIVSDSFDGEGFFTI